jgi:hypothetical protein
MTLFKLEKYCSERADIFGSCDPSQYSLDILGSRPVARMLEVAGTTARGHFTVASFSRLHQPAHLAYAALLGSSQQWLSCNAKLDFRHC